MPIQRLHTDLTGVLPGRPWPSAVGRPRVGFVHDLEAPPKKGLGRELLSWAKGAGVSPHWVSDPGGAYLWLPTTQQGSHVGGGNPYGVGYEVTGYAAWSRSTWLAQGIDGLRWQAYCMAVDAERWGFAMEWGSLTELARGVPKFYTHNDSRLVFKGTTHYDPADGYPYDVVMKMVREWYYGKGSSGPVPNPTPQPGAGAGQGAQPGAGAGQGGAETDWFANATVLDVAKACADR